MKLKYLGYRLKSIFQLFRSLFTTKNPKKLCGRNEPCFREGTCWGHFEGTLCAYISELPHPLTGKCLRRTFCGKTFEKTRAYTTQEEYEKLIK